MIQKSLSNQTHSDAAQWLPAYEEARNYLLAKTNSDRGITPNVSESVPRLLTVQEVSKILKISDKSVYRLVTRGFLQSLKPLRHIRIPAESLDKFVMSAK